MTTHVPTEFYVGDTWEIECTCHAAGGAVLNLTGAAIEWKLYLAGVQVLSKTIGNGIAVTNPASGACLITVEPGESATFAPGVYFDKVRVTLASGEVTTQSAGRVDVIVAGVPAAPPAAAQDGAPDWSDPCAMLAWLRPLYYKAASGQTVSIRIGDEEVKFGSTNVDFLRGELGRLEDLCRIKQGLPARRAAISATYAPRGMPWGPQNTGWS